MSRRLLPRAIAAVVFSATVALAQEERDDTKSNASDVEETEESEALPDISALYETGRALFEAFAPDEIKEEYEFPTPEQWDTAVAEFQHALENNDLSALAKHEEEARATLATLRAIPGAGDYADWLQERLDYIEAAKQAASAPEEPITEEPKPVTPADAPRVTLPTTPATPPKPPSPAHTTSRAVVIPYYDLWLERMRARPVPERAPKLLPVVRAAFEAEGVPAELAWLAEAESTFNPNAKSPVGAKGLFQLMPETAKGLGLSTFLPDERTHVEKSARAAARLLRRLHQQFGNWPLALAAYNAGEGRVRRLMEKKKAATFAEIASALPSETRMYVPKVCATVAVRSGVTPDKLAPPRA
ncbi:MAG: lytic transglycosylase domain-containing protein [Opitutus sp.]|nr:lytic transglycosylase domain-containing protein [Opitutus sp.]